MKLNIDNGSLRYGADLGIRLSILEWKQYSTVYEAQQEFEKGKKEIIVQLSLENIYINDSGYHTFSQSVLNHYLRTNIEIYSAILIGICIHRCSLVGTSSKYESNVELQNIAETTLISIPRRIIPDKKFVFDIILKHKQDGLFEIIDILEQLSQTPEPNEVKSSSNTNEKKPTLFLSYSHNDAAIANLIENQLKYETNDGIVISKYTKVPFKGSFKKFMNSIQDHDFVLSIVSDNYLKSQACMYEVGEIIKDHNFDSKLLFVVLNEKDDKYYSCGDDTLSIANIYGSEANRLKYVEFWQDRYEELETEIKKITDIEAKNSAISELKIIGRIYRNDISSFLEYLADNNGRSFDDLYRSNFTDVLKWIFPKWESKLFLNCKSISKLLFVAIEEVWKITSTDYNQVALHVRTSKYETGLMVFGDNIVSQKQRYRLIIMEGLMGEAFATGNIINIGDVKKETRYFNAVEETKSELVVPIKFQGNIIGVINSESEELYHYSELIEQRICTIANELSIALTRMGFTPNLSSYELPYIHAEF